MAFIKSKEGKKGTTFYVVYNQKVRLPDGSITCKRKWLKVGKNKTEAKQALRQFEKEQREKPEQFISKKSICFQTFIDQEFLPWCKTRKKYKEYSRTYYTMLLIKNYFGSIQLTEITSKLIEDYIAWRKHRKHKGKYISNRTVNIDLIYLSQCLKLAIEWGHLDINPCKKIRRFKESKNRIRFFSEAEVKTLLQLANPYIKQYLIVGLSTGLRLKEMLSLKISNIDIKNNIIHVVNDDSFQTKNGRNRDIPISQFLKPYLDTYLKYWIHPRTFELQKRSIAHMETLFCNKHGQPIKSFKTSYNHLIRLADIKHATIHTMRHTFASHLVMKGVSIRTVQELLGHSSISVTEMVSHLSAGFKKKTLICWITI